MGAPPIAAELVGSALAEVTDIRTLAEAARPYLANVTAFNLAKWRRALAAQKVGSASPSRVVCVGDSTTRTPYGTPTSNGGPRDNGRMYSWPIELARDLAALGYPTNTNAIYGYNTFTTPAQFMAYEPQVVFASAAWVPSANESIGGPMFKNATDTSPMTVNFTQKFNTVRVAYRQKSGGGSFTLAVAEVSLATVNTGTPTTDAMKFATVQTGSAAAIQSIAITPTAVSNIEIIGVEAWDSAAPGIIFINGARGSWNTSNWSFFNAVNTWRPGSAVQAIAPDLIFLSLGVNDVNTVTGDPNVPAVSLSAFSGYLQNIITQFHPVSPTTGLSSASDLVLLTFDPQDHGTFSSIVNQDAFAAEIKRLASVNSVPCIDVYGRAQNRVLVNAMGFMGDARHMSSEGHADKSALISKSVTGL